jgi:hypothetical protein
MEATGALDDVIHVCESEGLTAANIVRLADALAGEFGVRSDEVAVLRVVDGSLVFLHPEKLTKVGSIPLSSVSSIAAASVTNRRAQVFNNFTQTRHTSIFEAVDLSNSGMKLDERLRTSTIQKLMTAPVVSGSTPLGVLEICRKGPSDRAAGPDFSAKDLQKLIGIASKIAPLLK